jgi:hypothetical protein
VPTSAGNATTSPTPASSPRVAEHLGGSFGPAVLALILASAAIGAGLCGQISASRRRVASRSCKPIATAIATKQMAAMTA